MYDFVPSFTGFSCFRSILTSVTRLDIGYHGLIWFQQDVPSFTGFQ